MCKLKQRYAGVEGYVIECVDCGLLRIGFGTTVLSLNAEDFRKFTIMVASWAQGLLVSETPSASGEKCVMLPTPMPACQICLTPDELQRLDHMLQIADNELLAEELLRLFEEE